MLTAEEKSLRRIGGTTIAKICGESRFGTQMDAYLECIHEAPDIESNEDMDRGNFLEPALREWAGKKTGIAWEKTGVIQHPLHEWATFSPDGIPVDPRNTEDLLELKAPGPWTMSAWGEEGTDQVPPEYAIQVQWGMTCTYRRRAFVGALIDGKLKIFVVPHSHDLEYVLLQKAERFWRAHVEPRVPPPLEVGDDKYLRQRFPRANRPHLEVSMLTGGQTFVVEKYLAAYRALQEAKSVLETFELPVKELIGEAGGINLGPAGRIDWKNNKDGTKVDYEAVCREAGVAEELLEEHTSVRPGARVFRPYLKGDAR